SHAVSVLSLDAGGAPSAIAGSPFVVNARMSDSSLALSPDGRFLFVGSNETFLDRRVDTLQLSESGAATVTGSVLVPAFTPSTVIAGMKVTPDGRFVAVATLDGIVMLAVAANGTLSVVPGSPFRGGAPGGPLGVDINAAGTLLFSGEAT